MVENKDNVLYFADAKAKQNKPKNDLKETIIKQIEAFKNPIVGGIILFLTEEQDVVTGFFDTSFKDEAVLKEALSQDIFLRQQHRQYELSQKGSEETGGGEE